MAQPIFSLGVLRKKGKYSRVIRLTGESESQSLFLFFFFSSRLFRRCANRALLRLLASTEGALMGREMGPLASRKLNPSQRRGSSGGSGDGRADDRRGRNESERASGDGPREQRG